MILHILRLPFPLKYISTQFHKTILNLWMNWIPFVHVCILHLVLLGRKNDQCPNCFCSFFLLFSWIKPFVAFKTSGCWILILHCIVVLVLQTKWNFSQPLIGHPFCCTTCAIRDVVEIWFILHLNMDLSDSYLLKQYLNKGTSIIQNSLNFAMQPSSQIRGTLNACTVVRRA